MDRQVFVAEPFDFAAASAAGVLVELDTTVARVVSLDGLIALKRASGRPQDLADVEALDALRAESEDVE